MVSRRIKDRIKSKILKIDKTLLFIVYTLVIISTFFVYSASRNYSYVKNNILWICIGSIIILFGIFIDYRVSKKYIKFIFLFSVLILIYTSIFGKTVLGAKRWVKIFFIQIQPSEFVKILVLMIYSYWIVKKFKNGINNLISIIIAFAPSIPILILLLLQPDLGTTLIICFSFLTMLFLSNANMKPIIGIFIAISLVSIPIYKYVLKDYQRTRIEVFLSPEKDIKGKGWHVYQSKISIGSGQTFGKGYLEGSQSRLKFLPEPQTDFIFSVIGEEMGFVGTVSILLIYLWFLINIINISKIVVDDYGRNILYGIVGIFLAHIIINVGMTIGIIPVTGKPLLLLSYGGSSFLSSFIMIALIQSIKIHNGE